MSTAWTRLGTTLALAIALAACGSEDDVSTTSGSAHPATPPAASARVQPDIQPGEDTVTTSLPVAAMPRVTTLGTRAETSRDYGRSAGAGNGNLDWNAFTYDRPAEFAGMVTLPTQLITMDDGTRLAAKVTLPAGSTGQAASGRFPVVLVQTSYNSEFGSYAAAIGGADPYIVQRGYATVVVDVRGTGNSEGQWEAFSAREQADYRQVVDWVAQQSWSDGRIGLYGVSYLGITSVLTAAQQHPAVKAAFPIVPIGDGYRDVVFTGGQVNATFIPLWLTLVTALGLPTYGVAQTDPMAAFTALVDHLIGAVANFQLPTALKAVIGDSETAYDNDFWAVRSPMEQAARITVPTFVVGGLQDLFQRSEPMWFERLKDRVPTKLLIGPWTHIAAANVPSDGLPADGIPRMNQILLRWFDHYVKGITAARADQIPNVTQFVTGHGYATATDWPHARLGARRLFLHGDKSLGTSAPQTAEATALVPQSPLQGLCSASTSQWTAGAAGLLPLPCFDDDRINQLSSAVFSTAPLTEDLYLNGPIQADIWVSTTSLDAGLSVRVSDLDPVTGKATPLSNGLLTASLRQVDASRSRYVDGMMLQPWHPFTKASLLPVTPNEPMLMRVEIFPTSALLKQGHRLQISLAASNLPQGLAPAPSLLPGLLGALTIHNTPELPSSVVLPVVPASVLN